MSEPMNEQQLRLFLYTALVHDPKTKDCIVFNVKASDHRDAITQIHTYYKAQDWGKPGRIEVRAYNANWKNPVQLGHAYWEYKALQERITELCKKLLDAADGMEGNEGDTKGRDELYAYLATFEEGRAAIDTRFTL